MTIQVTIKHDNVGYPKNVRIRPYRVTEEGDTEWETAAHTPVIKGGESISLAVWSGRCIAIEETTDVADSDAQANANA